MNLIIWLLTGGLLGSSVGMMLSLFTNQEILIGNAFVGLSGGLLFGLLGSKLMPDTPVFDLDQQSFSPGSAVWAFFGSIITLTGYNCF